MCELCDMWGDFPMTPWLVELNDGPCDGQVIAAPAQRCERGLPSDRIYATTRQPSPSPTNYFPIKNRTNHLQPVIPARHVYERGEAINEDTHRWPYIYAGTV